MQRGPAGAGEAAGLECCVQPGPAGAGEAARLEGCVQRGPASLGMEGAARRGQSSLVSDHERDERAGPRTTS